MTISSGLDNGTKITPGNELSALNRLRCSGIVRTSPVTRTRFSSAAKRSTSSSVVPSAMTPTNPRKSRGGRACLGNAVTIRRRATQLRSEPRPYRRSPLPKGASCRTGLRPAGTGPRVLAACRSRQFPYASRDTMGADDPPTRSHTPRRRPHCGPPPSRCRHIRLYFRRHRRGGSS